MFRIIRKSHRNSHTRGKRYDDHTSALVDLETSCTHRKTILRALGYIVEVLTLPSVTILNYGKGSFILEVDTTEGNEWCKIA